MVFDQSDHFFESTSRSPDSTDSRFYRIFSLWKDWPTIANSVNCVFFNFNQDIRINVSCANQNKFSTLFDNLNIPQRDNNIEVVIGYLVSKSRSQFTKITIVCHLAIVS